MTYKHIHSRDNPVYRDWLALATDKRARRDSGRTLLEGHHLAQAALDAGSLPLLGWMLSETAFQDGRFAALMDRAPGLSRAVVTDGLFKALTTSPQPTGLMAMAHRLSSQPGPPGRALFLEDVQDPGNLGALIRTAAAAGARAVYLSPGCAEAWSPKCLRGGQGGHFLLAVYEDCDLPSLAASLANPCLAAVLGTAESLYKLDLGGDWVFAFGNEGAGLSPGLLRHCRPFTIPMPGAMESLNVAAAAAVCLFEAVRQGQAEASNDKAARGPLCQTDAAGESAGIT